MTTAVDDRIADRRGRGRVALAVLAAAGPLATAAVQLVLPYSAGATPTEIAAAAADRPSAMGAVLWVDLLIALTLPVAAIAVSVVAIRVAPVWGGVGGVLTVAGSSAAAGSVLAIDLIAEAANRAGTASADVVRLLESLVAHPSAQVGLALFLAGVVLGPVLLGIALWRGRAVPVWVAVALIVSGPSHVVFGVVVPSALLAALAWLLTAVGFTAAVTASGESARADRQE